MGKRREGREAAVQFLFAQELRGESVAEENDAFWSLHMARTNARTYAEELIKGVLEHLPEIDARIEAVVKNYRMERLAGVDRNILRLAVYELIHLPDVPRAVVINEAIEIAKKYGAGESSGFVNGILDKIKGEHRTLNIEHPTLKEED